MFFSVINIMTFQAKCFNLCLLFLIFSLNNVENQLCMPGYPCRNNENIDGGNRQVNRGEQSINNNTFVTISCSLDYLRLA